MERVRWTFDVSRGCQWHGCGVGCRWVHCRVGMCGEACEENGKTVSAVQQRARAANVSLFIAALVRRSTCLGCWTLPKPSFPCSASTKAALSTLALWPA